MSIGSRSWFALFAATLLGSLAGAATASAAVDADTPGAKAAAAPAEPEAAATVDPRTEAIQEPIRDRNGKSMRALHQALAATAAGKGQTRIAFWGASHTAADFWTGQVRRKLQERFGDAGHGYVMPVRWHLGLRHQDVNVSASKGWQVHRYRQLDPLPVGDFGFGGVAVSSSETAEWFRVSTCTDNVCGRNVNRIEVWLRSGPKAGGVLIRVDGEERKVLARSPRTDVLLHTIALPDGAHEVEVRPLGDGETYLYGAIFDRKEPGVIVDQAGIPGMRGEIWLHWRPDRFVKMVRHRAPHLIVLAYGTNAVGDDAPAVAEQARQWRQVLLRARSAAPKAACLIIGTTDRPMPADGQGMRAHRSKIDTVTTMQRRVAAEYGCGHWDAFAAMGGRGSMARWVAAGLARGDWVHLTPEGYELLGDRLVDALLRGVPAAKPTTP